MNFKTSKTHNRMTRISDQLTAFDTPDISFNEIDYYVARARRLRAEAVAELARKAKTGLSRGIAYLLRPVQAWLRFRPPPNQLDRLDRLAQAAREKEQRHAQAIAELSAYSDAELADLGIARTSIESVVRHGRPGFPEQKQHRAA